MNIGKKRNYETCYKQSIVQLYRIDIMGHTNSFTFGVYSMHPMYKYTKYTYTNIPCIPNVLMTRMHQNTSHDTSIQYNTI